MPTCSEGEKQSVMRERSASGGEDSERGKASGGATRWVNNKYAILYWSIVSAVVNDGRSFVVDVNNSGDGSFSCRMAAIMGGRGWYGSGG